MNTMKRKTDEESLLGIEHRPSNHLHQTDSLRLMVSGLELIPRPSLMEFLWCPVSQPKYRAETYALRKFWGHYKNAI
jgi:hypothetical protein